MFSEILAGDKLMVYSYNRVIITQLCLTILAGDKLVKDQHHQSKAMAIHQSCKNNNQEPHLYHITITQQETFENAVSF